MSVRTGGDPAGSSLLLLHGLGATSRVWDGLIDRLDDGWRWGAPDLPGHGGSAPLTRYSIGGLAAAVAPEVDRDRPLVVLGHSLGGAVGLALASGWFGVSVVAVCGLGIKVRWSDAELAKAAEVAARPNRVYDSRQDAVDRALKVAGLAGLVTADAPAADAGVVRADDGWTLALDPAAFGVGAPDMDGLLAAARAPVILAAGEHDPMGPPEHLHELRPDAVTLPGLGHNAHVEDPTALLPLLDRLRNTASGAGDTRSGTGDTRSGTGDTAP
ncbi:MAG: alpha/beta fold hydrolase [Actinophytocola sp.]|nr:alpha/beta fold hydrolase [Actinophytocola sp.]